jgi:hypothetical protein
MWQRAQSFADLLRAPLGGGVVTDDGWIEFDPRVGLPPAIGAPRDGDGRALARAFLVCATRSAALEAWADAYNSYLLDPETAPATRFRGTSYVRFVRMPCVRIPSSWDHRDFIYGRHRDQRLRWLEELHANYGTAAAVGDRGPFGIPVLVLEAVREEHVVLGDVHVYEQYEGELEVERHG